MNCRDVSRKLQKSNHLRFKPFEIFEKPRMNENKFFFKQSNIFYIILQLYTYSSQNDAISRSIYYIRVYLLNFINKFHCSAVVVWGWFAYTQKRSPNFLHIIYEHIHSLCRDGIFIIKIIYTVPICIYYRYKYILYYNSPAHYIPTTRPIIGIYTHDIIYRYYIFSIQVYIPGYSII